MDMKDEFQTKASILSKLRAARPGAADTVDAFRNAIDESLHAAESSPITRLINAFGHFTRRFGIASAISPAMSFGPVPEACELYAQFMAEEDKEAKEKAPAPAGTLNDSWRLAVLHFLNDMPVELNSEEKEDLQLRQPERFARVSSIRQLFPRSQRNEIFFPKSDPSPR